MPTLCDHPSPETLVRFYERELSVDDTSLIQVHVVTCEQCLNTIEKVASAATLLDSKRLVILTSGSAAVSPEQPATPDIRGWGARLLRRSGDHIWPAISLRPVFVWAPVVFIVIGLLSYEVLFRRSSTSTAPSVTASKRSPLDETGAHPPTTTPPVARQAPPGVRVSEEKVLVFMLLPVGRDEGDANILDLPSGHHQVQLEILLDTSAPSNGSSSVIADLYPRFHARIRKSDGRLRLTADLQKKTLLDGRPALAWTIDSSLLTPGEYYLVLTGVDQLGKSEDIRGYSFAVR